MSQSTDRSSSHTSVISHDFNGNSGLESDLARIRIIDPIQYFLSGFIIYLYDKKFQFTASYSSCRPLLCLSTEKGRSTVLENPNYFFSLCQNRFLGLLYSFLKRLDRQIDPWAIGFMGIPLIPIAAWVSG